MSGVVRAVDHANAAGTGAPRRTLRGWIDSMRVLGKIVFLTIRDGGSDHRVVVKQPSLIQQVRRLRSQTLVEVDLAHAVDSPDGTRDLEVVGLLVLSSIPPPLPFPLRIAGPSPPLRILLQHPALRLRRSHDRARLWVHAMLMRGLRSHLDEQGFVEVVTPKLLGDPSEGGAELFPVRYFGGEVFLSQSTQLYRQMLVRDLARVYEMAATFRANPHATRWHLNEYTSLDVEMAPIEDHGTLIETAAGLLEATVSRLETECRASLDALRVRRLQFADRTPVIRYREAVDLLLQQHDMDLSRHGNLTPRGNRLLSLWAREWHGSDLLAVDREPVRRSTFYDAVDPTDPEVTRCFIILMNGVSVVHGGQRWDRIEDYERSIADRRMSAAPLADYLEIIRRGVPPHGGFALSIPRCHTALCGLTNVREAVMFPRDARLSGP